MTASTVDSATAAAPSRTGRRPLVLLLALAMALVGLTTISSPATSAVPPYPSYQPQTHCSPSPKRGTVFLSHWLQRRYHGSGSYGISRACSIGGRSEHKEGRAFDWKLDARRHPQRNMAKKFLTYIKARHGGVRHVQARRMGVMYVIWNDKIFSAGNHYKARPYRNPACSSISSCSTTLRHRDHMHISLTRAGGAGLTQWFRSNM